MADLVFDNTIAIPESERDIDTLMDIRYNDRLVFNATGQIWAGVWFTGMNGPQGWDNIDYGSKFPLPGSHPYCLLGRLDGRYFYIGRGFDRYYKGQNSRLYLRINDDTPGNGSGSFFCAIQVYRGAQLVGVAPLAAATPVAAPEPVAFETAPATAGGKR